MVCPSDQFLEKCLNIRKVEGLSSLNFPVDFCKKKIIQNTFGWKADLYCTQPSTHVK
jgi:hypothetical protein